MIAKKGYNYMKITKASVAVLALATAVACKTDLTALNQNPNNPTTAPAGPLFTGATRSTMQTLQNSFNTLSMTSLFAQHIAQIQYIDEDRGRIRSTTLDGLFNGLYVGPLEDYQKIIDGNASRPSTSGPATVMQQWIFQNMTDMWGDIPYSEALQGDASTPNFKPTYDAQQDIYNGMLAKLTATSTAMVGGNSAADPGLGSADRIYGGDVTRWIRLSNSLRARMAMRLSQADPAKAQAELTAAFAAGVFTSNADNARLVWPGDGIYDNPWASNFQTRDDHRVAKTLVDELQSRNDPRLAIFAQPTVANPAVYAGQPNGLTNASTAANFNTTSRPGLIFYPGATTYGTFGTSAGRATPSYIMTYAEISFIKAEAAMRSWGGFTPAQAAGFYNDGVTASITQWGGTPAQAATYLAQAGVVFNAGTGLQQIGLQKWIALFTQGTEAWSEWRRTGFPASIVPGPSMYPDTPGIAMRLAYPPAELAVNKAGLDAAIASQGPDLTTTKVWWDKP
jgi:hypothetical protein